MNPPDVIEAIEAFCRDLTEHIDSVQVIATNCEQGQTDIFVYGSGNYYARIGACREFVEQDRGVTFARALSQNGTRLHRGGDDSPEGETVS